MSLSEDDIIEYLDFIKNSITHENCSIIWVIIGCFSENCDDTRNRHEYPPIIDYLFHNENGLYSRYANGNKNLSTKIDQYVIRIDPFYKSNRSSYPIYQQRIQLPTHKYNRNNSNISTNSESSNISMNSECSNMSNCSNDSGIIRNNMNSIHTSKYYWKKCGTLVNDLLEMNTSNKLYVVDIPCMIEGGSFDFLMSSIEKIQNNNQNVLSAFMDMSFCEFYRKYTVNKMSNNKIWIGPTDCLANVLEPIYHPIVIYKKNKNGFKWASKIADLNTLRKTYNEVYKSVIAKWNYDSIVLKLESVLSIMSYINIPLKDGRNPELSLYSDLIYDSIANLKYRLDGNINIYFIRKLLDNWQSQTKYTTLIVYLRKLLQKVYLDMQTIFEGFEYNNKVFTFKKDKEDLYLYIANTSKQNILLDIDILNKMLDYLQI